MTQSWTTLHTLQSTPQSVPKQKSSKALKLAGIVATSAGITLSANALASWEEVTPSINQPSIEHIINQLENTFTWVQVDEQWVGVDAFAKKAFGSKADWHFLVDRNGKILSSASSLRFGKEYTIGKSAEDAERISKAIRAGKSGDKHVKAIETKLAETLNIPSIPKKAASSSGIHKESTSKEVSSSKTPGESVLEVAEQYIGSPYRLGGIGHTLKNGLQTFDCSGFVGYIFKEIGLLSPDSNRYTASTFPSILSVKKSVTQAKKWDLVFIQHSQRSISHVSFVYEEAKDGRITVIDAAKKGWPGKVSIRNLPAKLFAFAGTPKAYETLSPEEARKSVVSKVDSIFASKTEKFLGVDWKKGIDEHIEYFEKLASKDRRYEKTIVALKQIKTKAQIQLAKESFKYYSAWENLDERTIGLLAQLKQGIFHLNSQDDVLEKSRSILESPYEREYAVLLERRRRFETRARIAEEKLASNAPGIDRILSSIEADLVATNCAITDLEKSFSCQFARSKLQSAA